MEKEQRETSPEDGISSPAGEEVTSTIGKPGKGDEEPVRFGAEFGPYRSQQSTGVSLSTFKTLVWVSNIGGLLLVVFALEMMVVQQRFYLGLAAAIIGIAIALFPSNYEIVGMEPLDSEDDESGDVAVGESADDADDA